MDVCHNTAPLPKSLFTFAGGHVNQARCHITIHNARVTADIFRYISLRFGVKIAKHNYISAVFLEILNLIENVFLFL